jgi:hypothetical protein
MTVEQAADRVRAAVNEHGLLLMQDATLPSLVSIVAGGAVKGSWWSHPQSSSMFDVLQVISAETLLVKLLAGKRTFVHSRLWPAVCAMAESREAWQLRKLKPDAQHVLELIDGQGSLRSDHVELPDSSRKMGTVIDDLEKRLLVHTDDQHTEGGHHARVLQTWSRWRAGANLQTVPALAEARERLEDACARYSSHGDVRLLPWRS